MVPAKSLFSSSFDGENWWLIWVRSVELCMDMGLTGGGVNDGYLRELQEWTKSICEAEDWYNLAFGMKGVLLKYGVRKTFNIIILQDVI
jgi:hypothetical protein